MNQRLYVQEDSLFEIVQKRLALILDDQKQRAVLTAVQSHMAQQPHGIGGDVVTHLGHTPTSDPFWQQIVRAATIGETYFFRDISQLNALRNHVFPALVQKRRAERQPYLRLWSAGCSTGEEPYTLAIMLREIIPDIAHWHISILATDLNIDHLDRARKGVYRPWSFRAETPTHIQNTWFSPEDDSHRIDRSISGMVTFGQLNLASGHYPSSANGTEDLDIIICRNVLIYFDNDTVMRVIERFHHALHTDGYLVLGHSESMHALGTAFLPQNFENAVLYEKTTVPRPRMVAEVRPLRMDAPPPAVQKSSVSTAPLPALRTTETRPPAPMGSPAGPTRPLTPMPPVPAPRISDMLTAARQAADREQWDEALRLLAQAERADKMRPEVHYLRSIVEVNRDEVNKAMESLRRTLYCDSNFVMAHYALGTLYQKQRLPQKAQAHWRQAQALLAKLSPDAPIPFGDDMTAEMLSKLILFRLSGYATGPLK